ncbi:PREDICTED: ATP-dependent DNA helicase RecQ-like [Acropora digitifera]|uniref:ATP-dependent DNA helicase RecQ-like n=1 Tax=Acropora digitifera TaxID=70779 RepID=UPI00077AAA3A|nr:PREDICTED: ATP-dependent DNA helicase RecQ-like [Acropora digitifera]
MAALCLEEDIESTLQSFPNINCLKDEQKKRTPALLWKKDVLGLLPRGFGKSLIFKPYLRIFELVNGRKNSHVIIVSALNAITKQHVQEIADTGISAVAVGHYREADENILKGEYKLVFGSAENKETMWSLVVDEAHVAQSWGQDTNKKTAFREAYRDIASIRSFLNPGTPLLALMATVEQRSREAFVKLFGMHKASVIDVPGIHQNKRLRFSVKNVKRGLSCFNWLVDKIDTKQEETPKTIVFCRSINDIPVVLGYLLKKLGHLAYKDENKSKCVRVSI